MAVLTDATVDLDKLDLSDVRIHVVTAPGCPPAVRVYCGNDITFRVSDLDKFRVFVERLEEADRDLSIAIVNDLAEKAQQQDALASLDWRETA